MSPRFPVFVSAVIVREGRVLLLKRSLDKSHGPGWWDPCSGRVESGEHPEQAAIREAREETGLDVEPVRVIDTFHFVHAADGTECIGITFLCRAPQGDVRLSNEHTEHLWVPLDDGFAGYEMAPGLREVLNALARDVAD